MSEMPSRSARRPLVYRAALLAVMLLLVMPFTVGLPAGASIPASWAARLPLRGHYLLTGRLTPITDGFALCSDSEDSLPSACIGPAVLVKGLPDSVAADLAYTTGGESTFSGYLSGGVLRRAVARA